MKVSFTQLEIFFLQSLSRTNKNDCLYIKVQPFMTFSWCKRDFKSQFYTAENVLNIELPVENFIAF